MNRRPLGLFAWILFIGLYSASCTIPFSLSLSGRAQATFGVVVPSVIPVPPDGYIYHGAFCGYDGASPTTTEMRIDITRFVSTANINKALCVSEHAGTRYINQDWFVLTPGDRSYMKPLMDEGLFKILIISINPCFSGSSNPTLDEQNIAAGVYDSWLTTLANRCKNFTDPLGNPYPLMVKIGVEVNQHNWEAFGANATAFKDAFRYIVNYFKNQGVTNVAFVWNVTWQGSGYSPQPTMNDYYPGDDVVDWLTVDAYRWGTLDYFDNQITEFYDLYKNKGKPLGVMEWGVKLSVTDDTQGASYVNRVFDCLEGKNGQTPKPEFKLIRYHWSADSGGNRFTIQADTSSATDYRPNTVAAYRTRVADPRYLTSAEPVNQYDLTVTSSVDTVGGVPLTIDSGSYGNTPTAPIPLAEGTHTISVPRSVQVGADNYNFERWEDDLSTNPTRAYNLTSNATLTATYQLGPQQFTLTTLVSPSGGGTVTKTPDKLQYNFGEVVNLTATPNTNYHWTTWQNTDNDSVNPTTVTMNSNRTLTAVFQKSTVTINVVGGAHGSVSPSGSQTLTIGQTYSFTATPNTGYQIDHWDLGGTNEGSDLMLQLTVTTYMDGKTLTALFAAIPLTLILQVSPANSGTVTKDPDKITYIYNEVVTLTATPNDSVNYRLSKWIDNDNDGIDYVGVNGEPATSWTSTVRLTSNRNLTAIFEHIIHPTLTLVASPQEGGSMPVAAESPPYSVGQPVHVAAHANSGYSFTGWLKDGSPYSGTDNPVVITMDTNHTLAAVYTPLPWRLEVYEELDDSVYPVLSQDIPAGQGTTVNGTHHPDYNLTGWLWDGSDMTIGAPSSVLISAQAPGSTHTLTAVYVQVEHPALTVVATPTGAGTVTLNPQPPYDVGQSVTATAQPVEGYAFVRWWLDGAEYGTSLTVTVSMDGNHTLTAGFVAVSSPAPVAHEDEPVSALELLSLFALPLFLVVILIAATSLRWRTPK